MSEPMDVGPWAEEKLDCLRKYLSAYTTIMRKQSFKGYFYVDAFAGSGALKIRRAQSNGQQSLLESTTSEPEDPYHVNYLAGSPRVALGIKHQFTHYVFVEPDPTRCAQLQQLKAEFPSSRSEIRIRNQDCNTYLETLLSGNRPWNKWRGIVFLDPFGMQVPWDTIIRLAATKSIEILINFPVNMAIQRLLKRSGEFSSRERDKLDQYFGTDEWFDRLYVKETDLVGDHMTKVQGSSDVLVRWYRDRLKRVFRYVSTAREIQDTKGRPLYYLIFAGHNRKGRDIANYVLKQGARMVR